MILEALFVLVTNFSYPTENKVGIPTRGGLIQVDDKRKVYETQFAEFSINPWEFFDKYPKDHVYIILDGSFPGGSPPYRGRGIILSKAGDSILVQFEDFQTATLKDAFTIRPDRKDIRLALHVNKGWIAVWAYQDELLGFRVTDIPDNNKEAVSLLVIGATSDFSGARPDASLTIKNLRLGRFSY